MVKITFELDDRLDDKFRRVIAESKGLHRGVIQQTIEEAIEDWIEKEVQQKASKR